MTGDEFQSWLHRTRSLLSGVDSFLKRPGVDTAAIQKTWFKILQRVDLAEAEDVVQRLMMDEIERPHGWSWSDLPGLIRRMAFKKSGHVSAGPEEQKGRCLDCQKSFRLLPGCSTCYYCKSSNWSVQYACGVCQDQGMVSVWSPRAMDLARREIRDGNPMEMQPDSCHRTTVRCSCETGKHRRFPRGSYDPECMVLIGWQDEASSVNRLQNHLKSVVEQEEFSDVHGSRQPEWDQWNEQGE